MAALLSQKRITSPQTAILANLREEINGLEGARRRFARTVPVCDAVDTALPYGGLPLGCVHEIKGSHLANAITFASLLTPRMQKGAIIYIAPDRSLYPLGLLAYKVKLEHWIHVCAKRSNDRAWAVLEAMRCSQVASVLAVIEAADLTFCRRLQLAAEESGTTGFLINNTSSAPAASVITRWRVAPVRAPVGTGFDEVFQVLELLYCRSGRPGKWTIAWRKGRLEALDALPEMTARPAQRVTFASENTLAG